MSEGYYVGRIFEGSYPTNAANWCDVNDLDLVEIESEKNVRRYQIQERQDPPAPTREEISRLRELAYEQKVDVLHAQKMRHQILGDWTEEDEAKYEANVIRLSQEIAEQYPYPEE